MKTGTILSGSYRDCHYFYRVVKATDKTVWLEELNTYLFSPKESYIRDDGEMPDLVSPGTPIKKSFRIKISENGIEYIKKNDHCFLYIWNGVHAKIHIGTLIK